MKNDRREMRNVKEVCEMRNVNREMRIEESEMKNAK